MATIHKLTKDGSTIFPATITDAVVHQDTGKTLTSMIKNYNVSELFPSEGVDGGNKYNLALAISVLGTHLTAAEKTGGISLTFISSGTGYPEEEYFLNKNVWSTNVADWGQRFEVGDVVADPSGSWTPSTAEQYIDQKVGVLNADLTQEVIARQTGDSNLQTQINAEVANRTAADTSLNTRVGTLEDNVAYIGDNDGSSLVADFDPQTDTVWKKPQVLSSAEKAQVQTNINVYGKDQTYTKTEVNGLVDTPHQNYVTVATYASLPASGSTDTIYRVSNYNGSTSQVDASVYSEYAWNGSAYIFLCVKSQIGEVFDISVYNNNSTYSDLAAALGNGGENVPESLRKGGMSVKYVQTSDNKYVQYRLMSDSFNTTEANWQGVDDEPTAGSKDLITSGGVNSITEMGKDDNNDTIFPNDLTKILTNDKWIQATVTKNYKILEGFNKNGGKEVYAPIESPLNHKGVVNDVVDNPLWADLIISRNNRIIAGIKQDGTCVFPKIEGIERKPLKGCVFMSLGDSITTEGYYIDKLRSLMEPSVYYNYAVNGATWADKEGLAEIGGYDGNPYWNGNTYVAPDPNDYPGGVDDPDYQRDLAEYEANVAEKARADKENCMGNQLQKIINNISNIQAPDIILLSAITNDNLTYLSGKTNAIIREFIKNQYIDSNGVPIPITTPTFDESDTYMEHRKNVAGAMRYIVYKLQELFPFATIFINTPIQGSYLGKPMDSNLYGVELKQRFITCSADYLSCRLLKVGEECGISEDYELNGAMWSAQKYATPTYDARNGANGGRDLWDGTHPNNHGSWKMAYYIYNKIVNSYEIGLKNKLQTL